MAPAPACREKLERGEMFSPEGGTPHRTMTQIGPQVSGMKRRWGGGLPWRAGLVNTTLTLTLEPRGLD